MKRALLALLLAGCGNTVAWTVSAPEPGAPDPDVPSTTEHVWAITPGPCSGAPPTPIFRGAVGDTTPPISASEPGLYCFWSVQFRRATRASAADVAVDPCELVSIGNTERSLPVDGALVTLEESVTEADLPVWDRAFETLVDTCAPRRFATRCECPFSPSGDGDLACAAPVEGDLIALGDQHSCVGRLGAGTITCWGDRSGFSSETGRVGPIEVRGLTLNAEGIVEPIVELDVGPGLTCARTEAGNIFCAGRTAAVLEAGGVETRPLRSTSADAAPLQFDEMGVGEDLICALGTRPTSGAATGAQDAGIYCFGRRRGAKVRDWSYLSVPSSDRAVLSGLAVGRRHVCVIASAQVLGASAGFVREAVAHCDGDPTGWRELIRIDEAANCRRIEAGGDRTCAISTNGQLLCWLAGTTPNRTLAWDVQGARLSASRVCARRSTGLVCGAWSACDSATLDDCGAPIAEAMPALGETPIGLVETGSAELCGVATESGNVLCATDAAAPETLAHLATTSTSLAVCPYPFTVP